MIFSLCNLIPSSNVGTQLESGKWVRAVHEPFRGGLIDRFRDAVAVFRGDNVFAVRWPRPGEYEEAVALTEHNAQ